jgi:hypothetical protein
MRVLFIVPSTLIYIRKQTKFRLSVRTVYLSSITSLPLRYEHHHVKPDYDCQLTTTAWCEVKDWRGLVVMYRHGTGILDLGYPLAC